MAPHTAPHPPFPQDRWLWALTLNPHTLGGSEAERGLLQGLKPAVAMATPHCHHRAWGCGLRLHAPHGAGACNSVPQTQGWGLHLHVPPPPRRAGPPQCRLPHSGDGTGSGTPGRRAEPTAEAYGVGERST